MKYSSFKLWIVAASLLALISASSVVYVAVSGFVLAQSNQQKKVDGSVPPGVSSQKHKHHHHHHDSQ